LRPLVARIVEGRARLLAGLREIEGLVPVASEANFMLVRSTLKPQHVYRQLLERDILIRDVSGYPLLANYFRVSVGTPRENESLLSALREICATARPEGGAANVLKSAGRES
jgi:histidinol-phosphate/aromatic aminotransferase/cobyric acid decarboxylase-like protein